MIVSKFKCKRENVFLDVDGKFGLKRSNIRKGYEVFEVWNYLN